MLSPVPRALSLDSEFTDPFISYALSLAKLVSGVRCEPRPVNDRSAPVDVYYGTDHRRPCRIWIPMCAPIPSRRSRWFRAAYRSPGKGRRTATPPFRSTCLRRCGSGSPTKGTAPRTHDEMSMDVSSQRPRPSPDRGHSGAHRQRVSGPVSHLDTAPDRRADSFPAPGR